MQTVIYFGNLPSPEGIATSHVYQESEQKERGSERKMTLRQKYYFDHFVEILHQIYRNFQNSILLILPMDLRMISLSKLPIADYLWIKRS
jgi:hypothetical protein